TDTKVAQISRSGTAGTYTYAVLNSTGSRPISYVSWWDSARFSNWMSNGQPSGAQTSTTTENGAYYVNGATSGNAVAANATNPNTLLAPTYRIPIENEWYKPAYYSPNYGGSGVGGYYTYATQSNSAPGTTIGSGANQANYNGVIGIATDVGAFSGSGSFYGTFDQTGNGWQWDDLDGAAGSSRGLRGGGWYTDSYFVSSSGRYNFNPSFENYGIGFRLASPVTTTLTPTFGTTTATADGFTVPITNYDSSYSWAGTATASGTVVVSSTGLVTVTGLAAGTSSTATITTTKSNTVGGSNTVTATSLVAMSMVTVGNAANAADTTGYGAVSYAYQIGAYDVTGSQYTAFLNAVGSTDTYALYNANMGTNTDRAQISQSGSSGSYTYAVIGVTGNRPITVTWFDSARFSNWMSNGQPSGAQTSTTTENGAYYVNGATSGNAVAANATNPNTGLAPTYRMPLENEWYKAAYYSPDYSGSGIGGYYRYATQSNTAPGTTIGGGANQANYDGAINYATDVGSFSGSGSFYGTFDQSGNVWQWNDLDGTAGSARGCRGGDWTDNSLFVSSSFRRSNDGPSAGPSYVGFRLASPVPALNPTFGATTATADGFTVPITNYDALYAWAGTVLGGTVVVTGSGSTGLATITGVAAGTSATATITTTRTGYTGGTANV
ncbi:MAG: SUMF1/EgtB/PvdO family nonheme iron enzyme, partial [Planctomycetota bacterium]